MVSLRCVLVMFVRRVPWITSMKRHFVAPETLRQLYAGKNLHHDEDFAQDERFQEFSSPHRLISTPNPKRLTKT
jgi:hypothetical protein